MGHLAAPDCGALEPTGWRASVRNLRTLGHRSETSTWLRTLAGVKVICSKTTTRSRSLKVRSPGSTSGVELLLAGMRSRAGGGGSNGLHDWQICVSVHREIMPMAAAIERRCTDPLCVRLSSLTLASICSSCIVVTSEETELSVAMVVTGLVLVEALGDELHRFSSTP